MGCFARAIRASRALGGAAKSISATHKGMTSALPNVASRPSYFSQPVPTRLPGASKSNSIVMTLPHRHLGQGMLEFMARLANHKRHLARRVEQAEIRLQICLKPIEGRDIFAVFLKPADPLISGRMLLKPGIGRGDHQQTAGLDAG